MKKILFVIGGALLFFLGLFYFIKNDVVVVTEYYNNEKKESYSIGSRSFFNDVIRSNKYYVLDSVKLNYKYRDDFFIIDKESICIDASKKIDIDDYLHFCTPLGWKLIVDTLGYNVYFNKIFDSHNSLLEPIEFEFFINRYDRNVGSMQKEIANQIRFLMLKFENVKILSKEFLGKNTSAQIKFEMTVMNYKITTVQKFVSLNNKLYVFNFRMSSNYYNKFSDFVDIFFSNIRCDS